MIEHVYRRASMCEVVSHVVVATCDEQIYDVVRAFGGNAMMTSTAHQRACDRVAEAALSLEATIVCMVQGDEPMVSPAMIERAITALATDQAAQCVNLVTRIQRLEEYRDPNTIKVVMDRRERALYFSREPIPTVTLLPFNRVPVFKQVCVIPFRRDLLLAYRNLEPMSLEQAESIDMLRLLEHGYEVRLIETEFDTHSVDTPEDLEEVEELMLHESLTWEYMPRPEWECRG
jgi:3-deoxy-manno-octulosonate cytidylyltransferase (CMP-KDO synthetase)